VYRRAAAVRHARALPPRTDLILQADFARRAWRVMSSAQLHRHLLAAAHDGNAPQPVLLVRDTFEVARLCDFCIVDRQHEVAALKTEALSGRAIGDVDDHYPLGA